MVRRWEQVFDEALSLPKTKRKWTGPHQGQKVAPHQIYLESLGGYGQAFLCSLNARNDRDKDAAKNGIRRLCDSSHLWRANTRGTPHHYHRFFPEDNFLKLWSGFLRS